MRLGLRWAALMLCCLAAGEGFCRASGAQETGNPVPRAKEVSGQEPVAELIRLSTADTNGGEFEQVSRQEYLAHVGKLQGLVEMCRNRPESCDAAAVGGDESVDQEGFKVHWYWLREVIAGARDAKESGRENLLQKAATRLAEDAKQGGLAEGAAMLPEVRKKADLILGRAEFRRVSENSYFEQMMAALSPLIDKLFGRAANLVPHSPWLAPLVEWGLLGLAAVGLLLWAWRSSQQQRLAIRSVDRANEAVWQKESDGWAERAREEAARQQWREAVHCLYWAAIVMLEGRRLWRQNRARTPREYLVLLEAGSPKQTALGGLTRIFERIWYGLRPARKTDYEQAKSLLEELRLA